MRDKLDLFRRSAELNGDPELVSASTASPAQRVYVIDDDAEVRKSLHFLLATTGIQSWSFADGEDFIAQVSDLDPAPILLDIRMPGMDGFGVIQRLAALDIDWPVIILSGHGDIRIAVQAMKQGAIEFIEKPYDVDDLETTIACAFRTLAASQEDRQRRTAARSKLDALTPREDEVIRALVTGAANKTVAHRLGLSTRTVEMHRASAMAKLNFHSIAEAALLFALVADRPMFLDTLGLEPPNLLSHK